MKWLRRILLTKLSIVTFSLIGLASYGGWTTYKYYEPFLADSHAGHKGNISDCLLNKAKFFPPKDSSLTEYEILFFTELTEKFDENLKENSEKLRGRKISSSKEAQKIIAQIESEQREILVRELNRSYISIGEYNWIKRKILASLPQGELAKSSMGNFFPAELSRYVNLESARANLLADIGRPNLTEKDKQIFADYGNYFSEKIFTLTSGLETDTMSKKYLAKNKEVYVEF